jgi:hypothetical protein
MMLLLQNAGRSNESIKLLIQHHHYEEAIRTIEAAPLTPAAAQSAGTVSAYTVPVVAYKAVMHMHKHGGTDADKLRMLERLPEQLKVCLDIKSVEHYE